MTTTELIAQAHEIAKKPMGYRYNPETLESIITAGVIPEGVTLATAGEQRLVRNGNDIVCIKNGKETRRTPLTPATEKQMLVAYAVTASKLCTMMGSM